MAQKRKALAGTAPPSKRNLPRSELSQPSAVSAIQALAARKQQAAASAASAAVGAAEKEDGEQQEHGVNLSALDDGTNQIDGVALDYDSEGEGEPPEFSTSRESSVSGSDEDDLAEPVVFSTWTASTANLVPVGNKGERIVLKSGETITIAGQFDLKVLRGVVALQEAYITAKTPKQRVAIPCTEALPNIRCPSANDAEIEILSVDDESNLKNLCRVGGIWDGLWECQCGMYSTRLTSSSTYTKISSSQEQHPRKALRPMRMPLPWQSSISLFNSQPGITIYITGSPQSGKSTFSRLLINSILTKQQHNGKGVIAYIELDSEKPDLTFSGHISLALLQRPLLQVGYAANYTSPNHIKVIKSHAVGIFPNRLSYRHIQECTTDLIRSLSSIDEHLEDGQHLANIIVSGPTWEKGSSRKTHYTIGQLGEASKSVFLTSDEDERYAQAPCWSQALLAPLGVASRKPHRTTVQRRAMFVQSHFHGSRALSRKKRLRPISSWRPLVVSYAPGSEDFLGVYIAGDIPTLYPNMLSKMLNGTLVSVTTTSAQNSTDGDVPSTCDIITGPGDAIPLLTPSPGREYSTLLSPATSQSRGIALIRGIDVKRKTLHLIASPHIDGVLGSDAKVILVAGLFEAPEWAYLEDSHWGRWVQQSGKGDSALIDHGDDDGVDGKIPWVFPKEEA